MDSDDDLGAATAARSVQVLTAISMMTENLIRARALRSDSQADRDFAAARAQRAVSWAATGTAQAFYGETSDPGWAQRATVIDAAQAWSAANEWAERDVRADAAQCRAETVLRRHGPAAMDRYDQLRAAGLAPREAMYRAAPLFIAGSPRGRSLDAADNTRIQAETDPAHTARVTSNASTTPTGEGNMASPPTPRHEPAARHRTGRIAAAGVAVRAYPVAPPVGRWARTTATSTLPPRQPAAATNARHLSPPTRR